MEEFLADIRPYFEWLYFASCLVIAGVAVYGIRQIRLMKADMKTRSERAAKEKAIEACSEYLTSYVRIADVFYHKCRERKLPPYKGPIGDFSPQSILEDFLSTTIERALVPEWLDATNKLESIAATFTTGVADEKTGFKIIGRTYCASVADKYDCISACRSEEALPYWDNIVELYRTWAPRLSKAELAAARKSLESQMSRIPEERIPYLGEEEAHL